MIGASYKTCLKSKEMMECSFFAPN